MPQIVCRAFVSRAYYLAIHRVQKAKAAGVVLDHEIDHDWNYGVAWALKMWHKV